MSGTSLDGIDMALCRFTWTGNRWEFELIRAQTITYSPVEKKQLRDAHLLGGEALIRLDREYGKRLGELALDFIVSSGERPDLIASHGHTVFHQPHHGFTFQIGNGASLAASSGLPVVADFRSLDVALGGQGAPLVPIGDRYLFPEFDFCLNLGGIANISFDFGPSRQAFDICPVNMALDELASRLGKPYDEGGSIARSGVVHADLLERMNALPFYDAEPPKTLGREWFEERFLPLLNEGNLTVPDLMATCSEHIAIQVARVLKGWKGSLLITGGGACNAYLIDRFRAHVDTVITIPESNLVNFKEALIFAFLGVLRWNGLSNTLDSSTGATHASSSGVIWMPGPAPLPEK